MSFSVLETFVKEYYSANKKEQDLNEPQLFKDIKRIRDSLLDDKFHPSVELKRTLQKQLRRARYPLEIAVVGQFSSGKSTFLNALISKNILPTGITPVTSKVNYINYGTEYKLKITFKSGAEEYAPLESIGDFTDQRKSELKSIKYLTIYAPIEMLKDISFVDTPGLNSLSDDDTTVTRNILRDVGGIIWLTLIDNAGKHSEEVILKEYMKHFKNKSLCVLNQKDRFSQEEVQNTKNYVQKSFGEYFSKVIPISAKMALESREHHKLIMIEDEYRLLAKSIKSSLLSRGIEDVSEFTKLIVEAKNKVEEIKQSDSSKNKEKYQQSNIDEVLNFIETKIRPMANECKEFAIKNDLQSICNILITEYESIIQVYSELEQILIQKEEGIIKAIEQIQTKYENRLIELYDSIEFIVQTITNEIYKNIKTVQKEKIDEKKGLFNQKIIDVKTYDISWIDSDMIYKNLFYDEDIILKLFKKVNKNLKSIEENITSDLQNIYQDLQSEIKGWQEPFELIRKHREIASNYEFSATRHFAAKVHENVLDHFKDMIRHSIMNINTNFAQFNGSLSYSYIAITKATVAYFKRRIRHRDELNQNDVHQFNTYKPSTIEINEKLKEHFQYERVEQFLTSKQNFLHKTTIVLKEYFIKNNIDRIEFVKINKNKYQNKIKDLQEIKSSI
jgi:predicted GTPase